MTTIQSRLTSFLILLLATLSVGCGDKNSASGPHVTVSLIADQDSVSPGSTFSLGIAFTLDPEWHIYWKNPGDSGLPPRFTWTHSQDVSVEAPLWPYPKRITTGPLVNYGYGSVTIPFPAKVASSVKSSSITIHANLQWLVCKDECLPGEGTVTISLPVTKTSGAPSQYARAFENAFGNVPTPLDRVSIAIEEQQDQIVLALIPLDKRALPNSATFFPEDARIISNSAPQISSRDGDTLRLSLRRDPSRRESITRLRGVLFADQGWSAQGLPKAVHIDTNPHEAISGSTSNISGSDADSSPESLGLITALIFAWIGGVLLNLMPCVFPVLSIKILSFVQHAGESPRATRIHGSLFSLGVVLSFVALAAIMLALRAGGEQLGWGFQLQSPTFVVSMIFVFLTLGLLFLTEVSVGNNIQNFLGRLNLPTSYIGSFGSGVLATAVATPCTAPFMGSALAATLSLPAFDSILIFISLGLGMSAPYAALSWSPALMRFLPRPGAWMATCKELMAFPLFASVVWLSRVFARQMGMEPPGLTILIDLLWGILAASFGFWLLSLGRRGRSQLQARALSAAALLTWCYGVYIAIPTSSEVDESRARACYAGDAVLPFTDSYGLLWEPYSEDRIARLMAQGRPIYIDFTAEWCITCQVNERVVFSSEEVRQLITQKNVTLVKADWTSKNPTITAALRRYGRNGVPLNVIIGGPATEPIVLPNILTSGIVAEALKKLPG